MNMTDGKEKMLVDFGNYLLSKERVENFINNEAFENGYLLSERLKQVHDADIKNFFNSKGAIYKIKNNSKQSAFFDTVFSRKIDWFEQLIEESKGIFPSIKYNKKTLTWKFYMSQRPRVIIENKNFLFAIDEAIEYIEKHRLINRKTN